MTIFLAQLRKIFIYKVASLESKNTANSKVQNVYFKGRDKINDFLGTLLL